MPAPNQEKSPFSAIFIGLFWLTVLVILGSYFTQQEDSKINPNRQAKSQESFGYNELVLKRNRHHHYVLNGTINEIPVTFLLDTGATQVVIPYHLANRMNLSPSARAYANTANGVIEVFTTHIDELNLSGIKLNNIEASLNPSMKGNEVLLGMSALKSLELIHRDGVLTIRQPY